MHTITGLFDSRPDAERAVESLVQEYGIERDQVQAHAAGPDNATAGTDERRSESHHGFGGGLHGLGLPADDHASYTEGLRRGGILVVVQAPDDRHDQVVHALERAGAVDLDAREAEWREAGWGGAGAASAAGRRPADAGTAALPLSTYAGRNKIGARGTDDDVTAPANEGVAGSPPVRPATGPIASAAARAGMSTSEARQPPAHATSPLASEEPRHRGDDAGPEREDALLRAARDTSGAARRVRSYTRQAGTEPGR